jgi:hypothetical protein
MSLPGVAIYNRSRRAGGDGRMQCEVCQQPATGQCKSCRRAFCEDHGGAYCFRCAGAIKPAPGARAARNTGIEPADYGPPRPAGKGYLQCETTARPTIHVDDPGPPSCHVCQALARQVCRNCHDLFCPAHGRNGLCGACRRSSLLGILILGAMAGFVVLGMLASWLASRMGQLGGQP